MKDEINEYHPIIRLPVLDKGFIKVLNISGPVRRKDKLFDACSEDIAISARRSFNKQEIEKTYEENIGLLNYLISNHHNTPVEMIELWIEMKLPIFVARQFVRHRTATINEVSARYVELPSDWYVPLEVGKSSEKVKQGRSGNVNFLLRWMFRSYVNITSFTRYQFYKFFCLLGVAREQARMILGLNHYTSWLWKQDLHNLMWFLKLRLHTHAQQEAREYAIALNTILKQFLPEVIKHLEEKK